MNNVVVAFVQKRAQPPAVSSRLSELVRNECGKLWDFGSKLVTRHVWMMRKHHLRLCWMLQPVSINRMDHVYTMAALGEGLRQPVNKHSVSSEVIRRIERGYHAKPQRFTGCHLPPPQ